MSTGTFSKSDLLELIGSNRIVTLPGFQEKHVGSASIDLTVSGGEIYRLDRFFTPSGKRKEKVRDLLSAWGAQAVLLGSVGEAGQQYLAKATIDANLSPGLYSYCNAKSTSGRNVILTRVIADGVEGYDNLDRRHEGWDGEVWILIEPLRAPVVLTDQECYLQVRFFDGDTRFTEADLRRERQQHEFVLRQDGSPYKQGDLQLSSNDGTVFTTLYAKAGKLIGFRLKKTRKALDLTSRNLDPGEYFEPVYAESDPSDPTGGLFAPQPMEYYLLSTNEMVDVPVGLCAELIQVHPRIGLFFNHFAGFFDPGFRGVPTLEFMTPIPTTLRHRNVIGCFRYERMRSSTTSYAITGNYSGQQRTTLPKQFRMPNEWAEAMK